MGRHLSTLIRPTVAVIAIAFAIYFQSNKFGRRKYPRRNLSQLPEEIILQIFRAVHDTPIPNSRCRLDEKWTRYDQGTRDIQNVRLTCQKFNRISSELLIKFVGVDLSVESLARLQAIMHHPTIGKGVGMIRIRLLAYDPIVDLNLFMDEMINTLHSYTRQMHQQMDRETKRLASWYSEAWPIRVRSVVRKFRAAAEPAHREHRRRYRAQHDLSKSDFIKNVCGALAMSRKPLRIEFTDRNDFIWSDTLATKENLLDVISEPRPSSWRELNARCYNTSRDYAWMIPLMLIRFSMSRVRIADLHFDTTTTMFPEKVFPAELYSGGIKEAMQNLRRFTWHNDEIWDTSTVGPEWRLVLYNCLPAASLRDLVLRRVMLKPMSQFSNLTRISLTEVEFSVERFALLLKPLKPHTVDIILNNCFLDEDAENDNFFNEGENWWADVLDLLRSKQRWTRLYSPHGFDIDNMSRENINYLFGHLKDWHGGASKAEQYILGLLDVNPIRQHLDYSSLTS